MKYLLKSTFVTSISILFALYFFGCRETELKHSMHYSEQFVIIPAGDFQMGWPKTDSVGFQKSAEPRHTVTLTTFTIARDVVPVEGFCQFLNATHPDMTFIEQNCKYSDRIKREANQFVPLEEKCKYWPIMSVSWVLAVAYCEWRTSEDPEHRYRLPTEAEWECAASNAGVNAFPWQFDSKIFNDHEILIFEGEYLWRLPVGVHQLLANANGIRDLVGSVDQWCLDYYDSQYYHNTPLRDPTGPSVYNPVTPAVQEPASRVLKGGIAVAPDTGGESILPRAYSRWSYYESNSLRPNPEMRFGFRLVREKKTDSALRSEFRGQAPD